ncbi:MAG: ribosome-associated protein [Candidatus Atribacteria bacterium]|nr:ribosome-associated protein [Candidatus Atribacteria bacterium]
MKIKEKILLIKDALEDKKALDLAILDLRGISPFSDFWLICSGESTIQTKTLAEAVRKKMKSSSLLPFHAEGESEGEWILLDYGDLIVHIFRKKERDFYQLEKIWRQARLVYSESEKIDSLGEVS